MKNVTVICDLQFGSTGKGSIAGYVAKRDNPDVLVTAWAANAGHTFIDEDGTEYIHTMLANGIVSENLKYVLLGPGSLLNVNNLEKELKECDHLLTDVEVLVHPHAGIITQEHIDIEQETMTGIGSTAKGCGAALVEKLQRATQNSNIARIMYPHGGDGWRVTTSREYNRIIDEATKIQVEGHQGFSLGLNTGFYPYVTSRECTPQQILTDCAIPVSRLEKVIGCMRTFPIRTADRFIIENGERVRVGWSGPVYSDSRQVTWDYIGVKPERTTVTQRERKIFTFSMQQAREAVRMCAPDEIFLSFCDYIPDVHPLTVLKNNIEALGTKVKYCGFGPKVTDIVEQK